MSLTMERQSGNWSWRCECSIVFPLVFLPLILINPKKPTCTIMDFYLPALNKSANSSTTNRTIFFDLKLLNKNVLKGIYYDSLNLTFSYENPNTSFLIANYTAPGFYQGYKKSTRRNAVVETAGVPWEVVLNKSTVVFRVDLATKVRFKTIFGKSKRKKLVVGADVEVDEDGKKVNEKGIKLSGSPAIGYHLAPVEMLALSTFLTLAFI